MILPLRLAENYKPYTGASHAVGRYGNIYPLINKEPKPVVSKKGKRIHKRVNEIPEYERVRRNVRQLKGTRSNTYKLLLQLGDGDAFKGYLTYAENISKIKSQVKEAYELLKKYNLVGVVAKELKQEPARFSSSIFSLTSRPSPTVKVLVRWQEQLKIMWLVIEKHEMQRAN